MLNIKYILVTLFLFISTNELYAQYHVTVLGSKNDVVSMRCIGFGKKALSASIDAELSAIKTILFVGANGTQYNTPLIVEEKSVVENKFNGFFSKFYNEDYKSFIESSVVAVPFGKNSLKQKCITLDVKIKVSQLRKYLENNDVIRKFGL